MAKYSSALCFQASDSMVLVGSDDFISAGVQH